MIAYIIWPIAFISLFLSLVWLHFLYEESLARSSKKSKILPFVSIAVPVHNEEKVLARTIESLAKLSYPKKRFEILIVDDGSTDNTSTVAQQLAQLYATTNIQVLKKKHGGKGSALNYALAHAQGELFSCVDSDSIVDAKALRNALHHFQDPETGAVISVIRVYHPKNFYEKIQRVEYILCFLMRRLMSFIETLAITPGVLSIYRTDVLRKMKGFDTKTQTEDLEIGLRLKHAGYTIRLEPRSFTFTQVPNTFHGLWMQRVRWCRGFVANFWKYRTMFLNRKHSLFGTFHMPLMVISIPILLISTSIIFFEISTRTYEFLVRSLFIKDYFLTHLIAIPTLKELVLGQKFQIILPLALASILSFYIFYRAHKEIQESVIQFPLAIWGYFIILPYLASMHWLTALVKEVFRFKRKW